MPTFTGDDSVAIATLRASGARSVAYDEDRGVFYVATAQGTIQTWDIATGRVIATWSVGGTPGGISLSDDGRTLLVTVPGGTAASPGLLQRFDTETGARTSYRAPTSFYDVEITDAGGAIVTGDGGILRLDFATGAFTAVGADLGFYSTSQMVLVQDGPLTLIAEPGISNGPLAIYDSRTGTITFTGDNYQSGVSSGFNWGSQAISVAAGLVVQFNYYGGINVYDLELRAQRYVSTEGPMNGMTFSADGTLLYVYHAALGKVVLYDTRTWAVAEEFAVGAVNWGNTIGYGDQLSLSSDGSRLIIHDTETGHLETIDLTSRNETFAGTSGADTLIGLRGNDTYHVNSTGDTVVERAGQGTDTVILDGLGAYTLTAHVENGTAGGTRGVALTGNSLGNILTGAGFADRLYGETGNDTLLGMGGDDFLNGGIGHDYLDGGAGVDRLVGGYGNDTFVVRDLEDTLAEQTGQGWDTVELYDLAAYTLQVNFEELRLMTAGAATLTGNGLGNRITGNAGDDTLYGMQGADRLFGGAGNDLLDGGTGVDQMAGGAGDDRYIVDNAGDTVTENAGEGYDTVYASSGRATVGDHVEELIGTGGGGQTLIGGGTANTIRGGGYNDRLYGMAGDDILFGNAGNDLLDGGAGDDRMVGGIGNDTYVVDSDADVVVEAAGEGVDTVQTTLATYALGVTLENLTYIGTGPALLYGNAGANAITGTGSAALVAYGLGGNDTLRGAEGDDELYGDEGADRLFGNGGADLLDGGSGADEMTGGTGDDVYVVDAIGDSVIEQSGQGFDAVVTLLASYTLGANVEHLLAGTDGNHTLTGNTVRNHIIGAAGNDTLSGLGGNDILEGGAGADTLIGGTGGDLLYGGLGADRFAFAGTDLATDPAYTDVIMDFSRLQGDRIDLSAIDARTTLAGDQAFSFIGTGAFTRSAGQVRYVTDGVDTLVEMDVNGDGVADLSLLLANVTTLAASDFVL